MLEQLMLCLEKLPAYLGGHMLLSAAALAVGLAISLPVGIYASQRPRLAEVVLGIAGIIQTVPSLALLALMVPLLGGMIGFVPAFIALTLYSILPALSNTITGIRGVDPALAEAARGLGMNDRQKLFRVELPLAAPVIISGIRTATVLVVGTATLVTPVGGTSLGNYIFQGLDTGNQVGVVFGCVVTALLAVAMDQLIRLLESSAQQRKPNRAWAALGGLMLLVLGSLYEPMAVALTPQNGQRAVVGNLQFTEQHILGEVLAERIRDAGIPVKVRRGLAENVQFQALCDGSVDVCVEYTGNIWAREMKERGFLERDEMFKKISQWLHDRHGVECLGKLGFENAYALAVPEALAQQMGLTKIGDLKEHAPTWEIAGDSQLFDPRPEWVAVKDKYKLEFKKERTLNPALMYDIVGQKDVQVIAAYTSDGRIRAKNLRLLQDPEKAFPPYDAILLLSRRAAARPELVESLKPLLGAIDLEKMQQANLRVDVEHQPAERAARELAGKLKAAPK
ncbi:MAG: ABC transporter permease/substrate-binding protein [Planctomycetia bacterium]|nr:ABC transporter permease/substrate-binding protein [Planctomycetia bacterium]